MNSKNVHYSFHILDHFMYMYNKKKYICSDSSQCYSLLRNKLKMLCSIYPKTLVFVVLLTVKFYKVPYDQSIGTL